MKFPILNSSVDLSNAERIESLKAGMIAALALTVTYIAIAAVNALVLAVEFEPLRGLQLSIDINLLVRVAIAFLSGFLFGITYRYVIREDKNSHLKDGAVLAFGLVRGLAPVEAVQPITWLLAVFGIESILCFLVARLALDWAIERHWVKLFKSA